MPDQSALDKKYFIDGDVYNCPYCNRHNVVYKVVGQMPFDWTPTKKCYALFVTCSSCNNKSMHLGYDSFGHYVGNRWFFDSPGTLDDQIFYSVPTSYFVLNENIPAEVRELVTEAEGCLKMNFLTGASACVRKAIYELLAVERIPGEHYEDRIKALKQKHPAVDPQLFDTLAHIQEMTSDKVHEQSWDKWNAPALKLILETLKAALHEMYALPAERHGRMAELGKLRQEFAVRGQGPSVEQMKKRLPQMDNPPAEG